MKDSLDFFDLGAIQKYFFSKAFLNTSILREKNIFWKEKNVFGFRKTRPNMLYSEGDITNNIILRTKR